jgi:hypothetical protein
MRRAISPLLQYVFMAWFLIKHRDNFTVFYFLILSLPVPLMNTNFIPTRMLPVLPKAFLWCWWQFHLVSHPYFWMSSTTSLVFYKTDAIQVRINDWKSSRRVQLSLSLSVSAPLTPPHSLTHSLTYTNSCEVSVTLYGFFFFVGNHRISQYTVSHSCFLLGGPRFKSQPSRGTIICQGLSRRPLIFQVKHPEVP